VNPLTKFNKPVIATIKEDPSEEDIENKGLNNGLLGMFAEKNPRAKSLQVTSSASPDKKQQGK
jgi:hypothetical protein